MNTEKSLLLQLRDAAKVERDELIRFKLRDTADRLHVALRAFADVQTGENLQTVNGLWAAGIRVLQHATPVDPTGGGARLAA